MDYRELTPEDKLPEGLLIDRNEGFITVVGADKGEVVALLRAFWVVQLDPLWVRDDHRGSNRILPRLWEAMKERLNARGIKNVEAGMLDDDPGPEFESTIAKLCKFAGGEEVKGRIFVLPVGG